MTSTTDTKNKKSWALRAGIGGATALAIVAGGIGLTASASTNTYGTFHEPDNAMPLSVTEGLVFSKNADLGVIVDSAWGVSSATPLTPLSDVASLSYTVDSSVSTSTPVAATAYAPSYQLVVYADRAAGTQKYSRLVFEPYLQVPAQNASAGAYTNLQDGLWWTSKIDNPADGSQSKPMPLSFFEDGGASGWTNVHVGAATIHQGSTTDVTSVVSDMTYNGTHVALGNADPTRFDQSDLDDAAAAAVATYKSTHHTADHSSIGLSRATLASGVMVGKTISVKLEGTISHSSTPVKYQWYVGGKPVTNATKATFKVPAAAKGKTVTVKVTGEYKNIVFGVTSNGVISK